MADFFSLFSEPPETGPNAVPRRVLLTGAAGAIGYEFARRAPEHLDLRLMVHHNDASNAGLHKHGEVIEADLLNPESLTEACRDIDTVIHLAGEPSPEATWDTLKAINIEGTYNLYVAASAAGCRRVVYASSIHAVSGYPPDRQVHPGDPVNPGDLYGVSKCFGEAMGRYMAEQRGLSVIAVRICWFQPAEKLDEAGPAMLDAWVSPRDMTELLCRCVDDETLRFAIVHGLSDNAYKRLDLTATRDLLRYRPVDDAASESDRLAPLRLAQARREHDETGDDKAPGIREEFAEARKAARR